MLWVGADVGVPAIGVVGCSAVMVSGVTWGEGIEHEVGAGFTGNNAFYNLIISGGTLAPNRDISVIKDFTFNVAGGYMKPQGEGTTDVWHIGGDLDVKSGTVYNYYGQSTASNISYVVSGNVNLEAAGTLELDDQTTGGTERYLKIYGNLINRGGKINSG